MTTTWNQTQETVTNYDGPQCNLQDRGAITVRNTTAGTVLSSFEQDCIGSKRTLEYRNHSREGRRMSDTSSNGNQWTDREMRTVEALMAQGMGHQERLDQYYVRPDTE